MTGIDSFRLHKTMASYLFLAVSALLFTVQIINGYPSGAPKKLCTGSMLPHHRHYSPQPLSTSPITRFNTTWNPDGKTISSKSMTKKLLFRRFLFLVFSSHDRIEGKDPWYIYSR